MTASNPTTNNAAVTKTPIECPSAAQNPEFAANAPPSVETASDSYRDIEELAIAAFRLCDDAGVSDFLDLLDSLDPPVKQEFWEALDMHNPMLKARLRDACKRSGKEVWQV